MATSLKITALTNRSLPLDTDLFVIADAVTPGNYKVTWAQIKAGFVPTSRTINTAAPLTGGGNLSADRTLAISDFVASGASGARGTVPTPGLVAGTTKFLREDATWNDPSILPYAPGSFTLPTGFYKIMSRRLQLTGSQSATLQGTATLRIT